MSRHELPPRPDRPRIVRAVIGWDRPLQTFFAQVFALAGDDDEEVVAWVGTEPGELPTPEAAIAVVAEHAVVPDGLAAALAADLAATVETRDGPEQRRAKEMLFGKPH